MFDDFFLLGFMSHFFLKVDHFNFLTMSQTHPLVDIRCYFSISFIFSFENLFQNCDSSRLTLKMFDWFQKFLFIETLTHFHWFEIFNLNSRLTKIFMWRLLLQIRIQIFQTSSKSIQIPMLTEIETVDFTLSLGNEIFVLPNNFSIILPTKY